jgi:hypothetical protein
LVDGRHIPQDGMVSDRDMTGQLHLHAESYVIS